MKHALSRALAPLPHKSMSLFFLFANLLCAVVTLLILDSLPPVVPILYGGPYGPEQLAGNHMLLAPPIAAAVICIVNSAISMYLKDEFLQKVLVGGMLVMTLLAIITVSRVIMLVGGF